MCAGYPAGSYPAFSRTSTVPHFFTERPPFVRDSNNRNSSSFHFSGYASPVNVDPEAGICSVCRYSRIVSSARGSRFFLCELAQSDPAYRKYPPLPVHTCPGFEPAPTPPGT
jgi:hypothetical protein